MPISMLYIAIVLFIVAETGSYALAGALSMVASLVLSVATPLWSRVADQIGQNKVLSITAPVHLIFLGLFVYLVKSDAPTWSWFTSAIIFEAFVIGSGQMVRRRWIHVIGDDRKLIDTAYSFEALVDEVIFTTSFQRLQYLLRWDLSALEPCSFSRSEELNRQLIPVKLAMITHCL